MIFIVPPTNGDGPGPKCPKKDQPCVTLCVTLCPKDAIYILPPMIM